MRSMSQSLRIVKSLIRQDNCNSASASKFYHQTCSNDENFLRKCLLNPIASWMSDKNFKDSIIADIEPNESFQMQPPLDFNIINRWKNYYLYHIKSWKNGSLKTLNIGSFDSNNKEIYLPSTSSILGISKEDWKENIDNRGSSDKNILEKTVKEISNAIMGSVDAITKAIDNNNHNFNDNNIHELEYKKRFMDIVLNENFSTKKKNSKLQILNTIFNKPHEIYVSDEDDI